MWFKDDGKDDERMWNLAFFHLPLTNKEMGCAPMVLILISIPILLLLL